MYRCTVINQKGKRLKLKYDGHTRGEVLYFLKLNGYIIIDVDEIKEVDLFGKYSKGVKLKSLSIFCKQIAAMLNSGITVINSLEIIKMQTYDKKLLKVLNKLYDDLLKGNTFSQALQYTDEFPDILKNMVTAGEISGNLDVVMERMSEHFEKEYKIENKIKSSMTYPILLAVICLIVVIFLLLKVMPSFVAIYHSNEVSLPIATILLLSISNIIRKYWLVFCFSLILIMVLNSVMNKNLAFKYQKDYIKLKIPFYKNLAIKISITKFTRTLSTLMISGISLVEAIETVSDIPGNLYLKNKIMDVGDDVKRGILLSESLKNRNLFTPLVHSMIKIGENSGSLDIILDKIADFYDMETDTAVENLLSLLEPVMIIIMAIVVGFIVVAMVLPMFDMVSMVQM